MNNEIKDELRKIEIPKELHKRVELGVKKVKLEGKKKKRYPKWAIGSVASLVIITGTWTMGGSYIADAAETLFNQIFGSKEQFNQTFPNAGEQGIIGIEQHLDLVKKTLSKDEFTNYEKLLKEEIALLKKMGVAENQVITEKDGSEEDRKGLEEINTELQKYEKKISFLTTYTLKDAQQMVNYPINRPTFIPEGYRLISEEARTEENNIGKDPIVKLQYSQGEFGFYTIQQTIDNNKKDELEKWNFGKKDSYLVQGYKIDYNHSDDTNVQGMRISVPEKGYKIIMIADILSKEEMEKILLSMVNQ